MYAVIETGGKQYRVNDGDVITVEKLGIAAGKKIEFDKVLIMGEGNKIEIGKPYIEGAKVFGRVVEEGKGPKVIIFKYKAKKDYRKKQGHRQPFTKVEITGMSAEGDAPAKKAAPKKEEAPKAKAEAPKEKPEEKKAEAPKEAAKKAEPAKAEAPSKSLKSMKKAELIAFAKENNIELDEKATNAVMIETIEAALK